MKTTVYLYDFLEAFRKAERMKFSREGLVILFYYLEELERDMGEEIELDVIALCCEFSEMSADEIAEAYDVDVDGVREYLETNTVVCGEYEDNGKTVFVFQQF